MQIRKVLIFGAIVSSAIVLSGCGNKSWSLFIYPNGNTAEESITTINAYSSFEECESGFEFSRKTFPNATFECGRKCKIQDPELGLYMCDKTRIK